MVRLTATTFAPVRALLLASVVLVAAAALAETAAVDRPDSSLEPTAGPAPELLAPPLYGRIKVDGARGHAVGLHLRGVTPRALRSTDQPLSISPGKVALSLAAQPAALHLDVRFAPAGEEGADLSVALLKRVRQAYATVRLFDLLTVDLGKFVAFSAPGVIEATRDWLGSRAERLADPLGQAGLRFALPVGEALTLRGSVLASQAWKTFNLSATVHPPASGTSVFVNLSGGPNVYSDLRVLFDVVINQALHDAGPVADAIRLVGHVEYFVDRLAAGVGSARAAPADFITATVGLGLHFAGAANLELRPELRRDQSLGVPSPYAQAFDSKTMLQLSAVARF